MQLLQKQDKPAVEPNKLNKNDNIIFPYEVQSISIRKDSAGSYVLQVIIYVSEIGSKTVLEMCNTEGLRVGMKVFEESSKSLQILELRAVSVTEGKSKSEIFAKFELPAGVFQDRNCRIVEFDFLYEGIKWFLDEYHDKTFYPIWIEQELKEVDIFEYYFKTYGK